jgi:hypothetical protein
LSENRTLLIIGAGKLGGPLLDVLAARYPNHRYVVAMRDGESARRRANLTRYLCSQWGAYPLVEADETDLADVARTADLLDRHQPDFVLNATTPFPWWQIERLPLEMAETANRVGPGMWSALDCILPLRLSQALTIANSQARYINTCYPDLTNAFLAGLPNPPDLGVGNISNLIPGLTLTFSALLKAPPQSLDLRLVCHHYTSLNAPTLGATGGAPYALTVQSDGQHLEFSGSEENLPFERLRALFPRVRGLDGQGVTVGSTATVIATLLNGQERRHHVPGPGGLPGGYPVRITADGTIRLDLPDGVTAARALDINRMAQRFDGIQDVVAGAATATALAAAAYARIVGGELPTLKLDNVGIVAADAATRLNRTYGLDLQVPA